MNKQTECLHIPKKCIENKGGFFFIIIVHFFSYFLCIYFCLHWVFIAVPELSLVAVSRELLFVVARELLFAVASLVERSWASVGAALRLQSAGSVVLTFRL